VITKGKIENILKYSQCLSTWVSNAWEDLEIMKKEFGKLQNVENGPKILGMRTTKITLVFEK
jgi:hypothetical protein